MIHCFNHRVELALKDSFRTTSLEQVDSMLCKLYCLCQKSPKRLSELRELSEAYAKTVPKPSKATGTRWIDHKYRAMELFFKHFGPYMLHLEQPAQTDSQALKRTEICGLVNKWKNANLIIDVATDVANIAIYLDVLAPIKRLSVSLKEERYNPVIAIRRITEFTWTMGKLKCLTDESLVQDKSNMTHFTLLMSKIKVKEGKHHYQGIKLSKYNTSFSAVEENYRKAIVAISDSMESRFSDLRASPVFKNLVDLLETKV